MRVVLVNAFELPDGQEASPALTTWPMAIFPTIMVPFFAVLHLVAVLQSRRDWEARARQFAIPSHDLAPSA
jgi:hypothetical protein